MMFGAYRCDHLPSNTATTPVTTWHHTKADAEAEEARLSNQGKRAVAWWDAQAPADALPRDDGRMLVREALQAAFGWLRLDGEAS